MAYDPDDTIAALESAAGGSLRGMVRLSGPRVFDCLEACFRCEDSDSQFREALLPRVYIGSVPIAANDQVDIPCDVFLWPSQRSYTRQPVAELHTLGSPPLLEKLLLKVCDHGARLAEPGEFTLRAFLAGRLDLTQAEAVLGVIDARGSADLQAALAQLAGGLSQPLAALRDQLLRLLAELEAGLDFVEEDIEFITAEQISEQIQAAQATIADVTAQLSSREDASDIPRVVLSGPPNVGKSSLFNALVERYAFAPASSQSLVSKQSGTTRDFVTAIVNFQGFSFELIDTAGVESFSGSRSIDQIAQELTAQQREQASLLVRCQEIGDVGHGDYAAHSQSELAVWTKSDLLRTRSSWPKSQLLCSSLDGSGLEILLQQIYEKLSEASGESSRSVGLTAARCAESLRYAEIALAQALQITEICGGEELIAAELRGALHHLGTVVGAVYTDDILDRIFGQFCIGK